MIILGYFEFHLKGYVRWIIVIGSMVLLITHYLIQRISVKAVLDIHLRDVKMKKFLNLDVITMHLLQKEFMEKILVLVCIRRTLCFLWDYGRKDG